MGKNYFLKLLVFITLFMGVESFSYGQTGNVYAISLDGAESFYVNDDGSNNLDLTGSYTFECWFNVDNYQAYDRIFDRRYVCAMSIIAANGSGDFALRFTERGSSDNVLRTLETDIAHDLYLDTWYHVAVTYNATTHDAVLYINGDTAASANSSYWSLTGSTKSLNIGGLYWSSGYQNQIDAHIDEVRVSNIARNISDIQTNNSREEYTTDANTVLLMHLDNAGDPPTYVSGTGLTGTKGDDDITAIDYVDYRIDAPDNLLRPNYQSKASGNWDDASTWNYHKDGTTWTAATLVPDVYTPEVEVQGGYAITLNSAVSLSGTLTLTNGIINTSTTNLLTINDGGSVSGANDDSYVSGPMKKIGSTAFDFPVGDDGYYAPISISAPSAATDEFEASYTRSNPSSSYDTSSHDANIDHVSGVEYWLLSRTAGSSAVKVTLSYDNTRSGGTATPSELRIAHWDGSKWNSEGGSGSGGTIESDNAISSFSPFTLASSTKTGNVLPIELLSFNINKLNGIVQLNWSTATETNNSGFEIQRSSNAENWENIGFVNGAGNSNEILNYVFEDNHPLKAAYYRLKQIDFDGAYSFSPIRFASFEKQGNILIYPNPASQQISLNGINPDDVSQIYLFDYMGKMISTYDSNTQIINIEDLSNGFYILRIQYANGQQESIHFIKK